MKAGAFIPSPTWPGSMPMPAGALATARLHLVASGAATSLGVVGPTPIDLIQRNTKSVYTFPQTTRNTIGSLALNGKTRLDENWQIEASAYMRALKQRHVDGNDGNFERCSNSLVLCGQAVPAR